MRALAPLRHQPVGGWLTPYPPTWLLIVRVFGALAFPQAWLAYLWASLGLVLVGVVAAFRSQLRFAVPLTLGFCGVWVAAAFGQNTLGIAGIALLGLAALPRHSLLGGICLGLVTFKPHLSVLIPLALVAGRFYRALAGFVLGAVGLFAASLASFGPAAWLDYLQNATRPIDRLLEFKTMRPELMISTYAGLRVGGLGSVWALTGQAVVALGAAVALVGIVRRSPSPQLALAATVVATLLAVPHAYSYDLVLLTIPILVLVSLAQEVGWQQQDLEVTTLAYLLPILVEPGNAFAHAPVTPLLLLVILQRLDHHSRRVATTTLPRCRSGPRCVWTPHASRSKH